MAITGELRIEVLLPDFYAFLNKYLPEDYIKTYGVPRVNIGNQTLEIDVLIDDCDNPTDWIDYKETSVAKQWQELKQVTK